MVQIITQTGDGGEKGKLCKQLVEKLVKTSSHVILRAQKILATIEGEI